MDASLVHSSFLVLDEMEKIFWLLVYGEVYKYDDAD